MQLYAILDIEFWRGVLCELWWLFAIPMFASFVAGYYLGKWRQSKIDHEANRLVSRMHP